MKEIYSNAEDCNKLSKIIYRKLGTKIEFWGSTYQEVISGKYHCFKPSNYDNHYKYLNDSVTFCYTFCQDEFLRLTISNTISKRSLGQKLAVLSDFYEILKPQFGEPTLFYTIKDDDEFGITIQWSFKNKKEDIENFKNRTAFDDGSEIEELIFFNQPKAKSFSLNKATRDLISEKVGLPFELLPLVDLNIEDYLKYKYGQTITYPKDIEIDGYPTTTIEEAEQGRARTKTPPKM